MQVVIGLGCDRGTSLRTLREALDRALNIAGLPLEAVSAVATIDKKRDEPGLVQLATLHGWPLHFFPAAALARMAVPDPSETVRKHMGIPAVAEAAALLAARTDMGDLVLGKYKLKGADGRNATVSIARTRPHD